MTSDDDELLREFALTRSEQAFTELAGRYANWVYSAALRMVRDPHGAEDVTQAVFLLLWQQPRKALGRSLAGWFFRATRYCAANVRRGEVRRDGRERKAAAMRPEASESETGGLWEQLAPLLEEMMDRLREKDRNVLLLRFYQGKSMSQIGESLRISEDAARKRVSAATEKLRNLFQARGVVVPAAALSAAMLAKTTHAAPAAVIGAINGFGSPPVAVISLANLARRMIFMAKWKLTASITLLFVVLAATATSLCVALWSGSPAAVPPPAAAAIAASAAPVQIQPVASQPTAADLEYVVPFKLGDTHFLNGDSVTIAEIRGTSRNMVIGNRYRVRGTFTLASHNQASLAIYLTSSTNGAYDNEPFGNNAVAVQAGKGDFTLDFEIREMGYPHLSFYPTNGQSFGHLYFGTGAYLYPAKH
jgi:RNA polymerase sigma factor (sigma-70 family)